MAQQGPPTVDAIVGRLQRFQLDDGLPVIEAGAPVIELPTDWNLVNFSDRTAYAYKAFEKVIHEMTVIEDCQQRIETGQLFVSMLYSFRSCSKTLPQVKTADQANKHEIYQKTYEVLEPEIQKVKQLMYFHNDTITAFAGHIEKLAGQKNPVITDRMMRSFIKILDLLVVLDSLKNMKAALNNDFSCYKRAFQNLRSTVASSDQQAEENQRLHLFLANQMSIINNLRTSLVKISGYDDVIGQIITFAIDAFEQHLYVTPQERHTLLRVMALGIFLMDIESKDGKNSDTIVFRGKKIKIERFAKLFKRHLVVPLYGDMQLSLESIVRYAPNFRTEGKAFEVSAEDQRLYRDSIQISITPTSSQNTFLPIIRDEHDAIVTKIVSITSEISSFKEGIPPAFAAETAKTIYGILQKLGQWTSRVLEVSASKYAYPKVVPPPAPQVTTSIEPTAPETSAYELVVRLNYPPAELSGLVEAIGLIKGLAVVLRNSQSVIQPVLRQHVYYKTQEFLQVHIRDMIRSISKKKGKGTMRDNLLAIRGFFTDWKDPSEHASDPAIMGKKIERPFSILRRSVPPGYTQSHVLRAVVLHLLDSANAKTGMFADKDFKSEHVTEMKQFYDDSFIFDYLVNYGETLRCANDLADLWYREFYLDLSKQPQFPIDWSLPWILANHVMATKNAAPLMECILYPLDLYNDAAYRALYQLRQRYLFDEVEAELNLAFDQLIFRLSETIYADYKTYASSLLMEKTFRQSAENAIRVNVQRARYDVLLQQRHIQFLGRSLDLNGLIAQRLNETIKDNIDLAINRFELKSLSGIVELELLLENIRLTHKLLSEFITLEDFEYLFAEANESSSAKSFFGRILLHSIFETVNEFLPNACYNSVTQRFVETPNRHTDFVQRDTLKMKTQHLFGNKSYTAAFVQYAELFRGFIGVPHIAALVRVVGVSNISLYVNEVIKNMELKVQQVIAPYIRELVSGLPPSTKLPLFDYGVQGIFGYFQLLLKDFISYEELKSEVFQNIRAVGNSLVLMNVLDIAVSQVELVSYMQAAPFLGVSHDNILPPSSPFMDSVLQLSGLLNRGIARNVDALAHIPNIAARAEEMYKPEKGKSFVKYFLHKFQDIMSPLRAEWCANLGPGDMFPIENSREFYRLWSALQFIFCLPPDQPKPAPRDPKSKEPVEQPRRIPDCFECYGDGWAWAGMTIIFFLNQHHRFEVFDFCYHILNAVQALRTRDADPILQMFINNAIQIRDLNASIFSTLYNHCAYEDEKVAVFHPPAHEYVEEVKVISLADDEPAPPKAAAPSSSTPSSPAPTPQKAERPVSTAFATPPPPPPPSSSGAPPPPPEELRHHRHLWEEHHHLRHLSEELHHHRHLWEEHHHLRHLSEELHHHRHLWEEHHHLRHLWEEPRHHLHLWEELHPHHHLLWEAHHHLHQWEELRHHRHQWEELHHLRHRWEEHRHLRHHLLWEARHHRHLWEELRHHLHLFLVNVAWLMSDSQTLMPSSCTENCVPLAT
eukprot:TRINITY_DN588_c0_g1_i6.p1 TRINITY_DN588_c0_g1~~TRINITY_DN588_c0_g1_i6.p1  ORF type:complete len:1506 (-),score=325.74 TRINITY_DN588_c0_g1_i6:191-4708(-)